MWVTLQFGSRNALARDFAPLSPIWLRLRLFHISIRTLASRMSFQEITHNIEVTLQFGLCSAFAVDVMPSSPIWLPLRLFHRSVSTLIDMPIISTYLIEVTLQCGVCNVLAIDAAPSSPIWLPRRLFHIKHQPTEWHLKIINSLDHFTISAF